MRFQELVATSTAVASVSRRLEKIDRLAALLERLAPEEIEIAVAFLSGSTRQGRIGIGWSAVSAAKPAAPAETSTLELHDVDRAFERIARTSGSGSTGEKIRRLGEVLACATFEEQDFMLRLLFGELRQGALEGILVEAIARAARISTSAVRRAAMMAGHLGPVAQVALLEGETALSRFIIQILRPVQPMLAESSDSVEEALGHAGPTAFEFKLDGARIQLHKSDDEVRIFSRTLRDVTAAVPEVVGVARALPAREVVLDGEVIARRGDGTPYPFQITMQRFGRRLDERSGAGRRGPRERSEIVSGVQGSPRVSDVERLRLEIQLTPYFFDCLYLDGGSLMDEPQSRRFTALDELAPPSLIVPRIVTNTGIEAAAFLDQAIRHGHEGVMAKALDARYAAGRRGKAWLKVKLAQSLDLVVLAAEWGHGRRRGWLSNLHLGARDPDRGAFVMLGKTFKGLTDEMLAWQTQKFLALEIGRDDYTVYLRPELVVEVAFNDIQESPHYPGGLALRFARVKGFRPDKPAGEADTFSLVQDIFRRTAGMEPPARE